MNTNPMVSLSILISVISSFDIDLMTKKYAKNLIQEKTTTTAT